ncbi:ADP-ribosylglycohydrolase family protein [Thermodesulfobacteriota bacterium]
MLGSIAGDIIGSVYESSPIKTTDFPLFSPHSGFTDDTVLTVAVADAVLNNKGYVPTLKEWGGKYRSAGFGRRFLEWLHSDRTEPYGSYGNGSAMRASPIGWLTPSIGQALREAKRSAEATHNHPEGIMGAQAVALAVQLGHTLTDKRHIKNMIVAYTKYDLDRTLEEIRPSYKFDITCRGTVPEAIICFLESTCWETAVRNAVSLGGDSDTLACIAGGIAEAFYGEVPLEIVAEVKSRLPDEMLTIIERFEENENTTMRLRKRVRYQPMAGEKKAV